MSHRTPQHGSLREARREPWALCRRLRVATGCSRPSNFGDLTQLSRGSPNPAGDLDVLPSVSGSDRFSERTTPRSITSSATVTVIRGSRRRAGARMGVPRGRIRLFGRRWDCPRQIADEVSHTFQFASRANQRSAEIAVRRAPFQFGRDDRRCVPTVRQDALHRDVPPVRGHHQLLTQAPQHEPSPSGITAKVRCQSMIAVSGGFRIAQ